VEAVPRGLLIDVLDAPPCVSSCRRQNSFSIRLDAAQCV
jgi:hypothetical protein